MTTVTLPASEPSAGPQSALMAVLFADLAGYGRHVARDEAGVLAFMERCFALFERESAGFGGRVVKTMGDGMMAVFPTASRAVAFGLGVQKRVADIGTQYRFRMGAHVGEVQQRDGDVFGHAVNVAARLEALGLEGGLCISHDVFTMIRHHADYAFESLGARRLKHVPGETMLYNVTLERPDAPRRAEAAPCRVTTIGTLTTAPTPLPRSPVARACLGYLALCAGQAESVDHLAMLRDPAAPKAGAQRSLRRAVQGLGGMVQLSGGVLRLEPDRAEVDVRKIEAEIRAGRIDGALARLGDWPERLLEGMEDLSPQFAAWLTVTRTEWRDRIAARLEEALDRFADSSGTALRDAALALLAIEPGHERAARVLIRHYRAAGNPGAAARVFERLKQVLAERYGIAPQAETVAAFEGRRAAMEAPARSRAEPLRLQVRRFEAARPEDADLLAGFRSELLAGLTCFRGWSVVEGVQERRSAASDYAVTAVQSPQDARDVSVSLIDVALDRLVWTDSFRIGSGQLDQARREAVGRIAATLEVYITTDRTSADLSGRRSAVVDDWLSAERLIPRWTPEAHDRAAALFGDLIAEAPDFAPAHASLASILNVRHIVRPGLPRDADSQRRAHALADAALELDPLDARNQLAAAWSAALDGAYDKAAVNMDLAARLNPHSPRTLMSVAMGFAFLGEHGRAAEYLDHSLHCAPMLLDYQWCYAASVHFLAGNDEAALEAAERSGDKIIDNPGWTAAALARLGRRGEAAVAYARLVREVQANWHGPEPATAQTVLDWFTSAYPFRHAAERERLCEALSEAIQGLNQPLE